MNANGSNILSKLPDKPFFTGGKSIKQTLLLLCLEKQIIKNDIAWEEKHPTPNTVDGDILEYKKIWLDCWEKKRNKIFHQNQTPIEIDAIDKSDIKNLYENIKNIENSGNLMWERTIYNECYRFEGYAFHEFTVFDKETSFFKKWLRKEYSSIKLNANAKEEALKEIAELLEIVIQPM